jgi:hypothetical protein
MPAADGRQFCIIYLSGVGDGLRWLLPMSEGFARAYSLLSYVSYYPVVNYGQLSPDQIKRCDVLLCHHPDSEPFADNAGYRKFLDRFGPRTRRIVIPRPRFDAFWPFYREERIVPPLPLYQPFWPNYRADAAAADPTRPADVRGDRPVYPFGDAHVLARLQQGISPEAVVAGYLDLDVTSVVDLDRLLAESLEGIAREESRASVKVGDFIAGRLPAARPFFTPDQPSNLLCWHIANGILGLLDLPPLPERILDRLLPFGKREAPIHPSIGRHFRASSISEATRYFVDRHRYLTFAEYIRGYAAALAEELPQAADGSRDRRQEGAAGAFALAT